MLFNLTKVPELKYIREMHYRGEIMSSDCHKETANRFYVDQQPRNASRPVFSGQRAAMRRPHPTSAINARRAGISSVTAPNKCRRTVRGRGRKVEEQPGR